MPIPLLFLVGAAIAVAGTVVIVAILRWDDIVDWFHARNDLTQADRNRLGFTVRQGLENGNYRVVQGIFDQATDDVVDARAYEAAELDATLARLHNGKQLVIYS